MAADHPALLLDVGSANVGIALLKARRGEMPALSHVRRTSLQNITGQNTKALASLTIDALKKSLEAVAKVSPSPETAHVILAAPWYRAYIKAIHSKSDRPVRIARNAVTRALQEYKEKQAKLVFPEIRQMESAVSRIYVNGYPTGLEKPVRGTSLKVNLYESEADAPFLQDIEDAVRATLPGAEIRFHSFPFAAFTVLRDLKDLQSFAILDIGGEITDLAVVSRESLSFIGSFPSGTLTLLRAVAGKGSLADSASRLSLYVRGELSEQEQVAFSASFEKAASEWNGGYQKLLESASLETPVPNTTFLFADKEELRWFERVLAGGKTPFPVRPILVGPDFFQSEITLGEGGGYDAFLSIAALYSSRHH